MFFMFFARTGLIPFSQSHVPQSCSNPFPCPYIWGAAGRFWWPSACSAVAGSVLFFGAVAGSVLFFGAPKIEDVKGAKLASTKSIDRRCEGSKIGIIEEEICSAKTVDQCIEQIGGVPCPTSWRGYEGWGITISHNTSRKVNREAVVHGVRWSWLGAS